jgi:DNA-binding transcriptional ArsR family regulator
MAAAKSRHRAVAADAGVMPGVISNEGLHAPTDRLALKTEFLAAVANKRRLQILEALEAGEISVTELNRRLPISQSALSQHLAVLRKSDLVTTRRSAQTIYYAINERKVRPILDCVRTLFG